MHKRRQRLREMFVPLRHDPGHAQVDFGEALAVIGVKIYPELPRATLATTLVKAYLSLLAGAAS